MAARRFPAAVNGRFLAARAAVAALVAALVLLPSEGSSPPARVAVALALLAWMVLGGWLAGSRGPLSRLPGSAVGLLLSGDTVAAAAAAWAAGGIAAPALLLIALPVLAGGLLCQCRVGLLLGVLAGALCGLLAGPAGSPAQVPPAEVIAYHGAVFVAVGLGAGFLGRWLAAGLREADETRRELAEVRLNTDRILESLACGLIALDAHGRAGAVNPEARRLLGLREDEEARTALAETNPALLAFIAEGLETGPVRPAAACACGAGLRARDESARGDDSGGTEREVELTGPDGRAFPAWVRRAPIIDADGRLHGLVALFSDLSDRKRLEEAARRGERLSAVAELSGGLAHEIRNSLKPITGCIELLVRRELLDERARPMIEVITREAESLEAFLSQFLALARDKTLKLETVDLEELIGTEVRALALAARVEGADAIAAVAVRGEAGLRVRADADWLRLAFRNVILNAIEARPGGRVTVTISPALLGGRPAVRVAVADEGPGFGALGFAEALRPFRTGKPAGTGLGLPIALRAIQEHGGRLAHEETPGGGATLVVELPMNGPSRGMAPPPGEASEERAATRPAAA